MGKVFVLFYSALFFVSYSPFDCCCQAAHIQKRSDCSSDSTATTETRYFPNIERVGDGYDIYKGNPNYPAAATGLDLGYRTTPIFKITYNNGRKTADGKFFVPDSVDAEPIPFCNTDSKAQTIRDVSEYRLVLDDSITISAATPEARFSASADYKTVHDVTTTHETQYYSVSVVCTSYGATLETLPETSQLTNDFVADVAELPVDGSSPGDLYRSYQEFIQKFGTHFVISVTMGGRYGRRYQLSSKTVVTLISRGFKMTAVAAAAFKGEVSAGVNTSSSVPGSHMQTFYEVTQETKTFSFGGCPPKLPGFNIHDWFVTVESNPQPVKYEFRSVSSLLTEDRFTNDPNISKKKTRLEEAVLDYCDSLNILYCRSKAPDLDPPPQMRAVQYNEYKKAIGYGDKAFYMPNLHSTHHKIIGILVSCDLVPFVSTQPTIAIDSSAAPREGIQPAIGWTVMYVNNYQHTAYLRPQCNSSYSSVSDFAVRCDHDCSNRDPSTWIHDLPESIVLPCILTRCLDQCAPSSQCTGFGGDGYVIKAVADGYAEFGANRDIYEGSFFRYGNTAQLSLDQFRCLSTLCLEGY